MVKRKQKDGSGFTMSALIRQVLMDMNAHSLEEITEHIQKFMCKTIAPKQFQVMVQRILEQDPEIEKTSKGFKLKSGKSVLDMVVDLVATVNSPLLQKDIVRKIAREQNVPVETVELDLDADKRFAQMEHKGKTYYYLARRQVVNDRVIDILKSKNRPLTFSEIYKFLETEYNLPKTTVIFIPAIESKIKRYPGSKFALPIVQPRKKPEKMIHNVTRVELERVVKYLKQAGEPLSSSQLSEKVLKRPVEETNLRIRLARDTRIRHEGEQFVLEEISEEVEIPQKVRERVEGQYFKVKARLVGSHEVHTIDQLLDRIYKINISHMEYDFYRELLLEHLMKDEGVVRTVEGWLQIEADPRTRSPLPLELTGATSPQPPPELQIDKLTGVEQAFLNMETDPIMADESKGSGVRHRVTIGERRCGAIRLSDIQMSAFPSLPQYYEIVLRDGSGENEFLGFFNRRKCAISDLDRLFESGFGVAGGILELWQSPENPYQFTAVIIPDTENISISARKLAQLVKMTSREWSTDDLAKAAFKGRRKAMSLMQIWMEINAVRSVSREELLAVLQDFESFVPDEKLEGCYRYDESAGTGRISVLAEDIEDKTPEVKIPSPMEAEPEGMEAELEETRPVKPPAVVAEPVAKDKQPPVVKRKPKRRKELEEEIPDHIRRLRDMGRRLPRLQTVRSMVVKPSGDSPNSQIGAVSVGRISHQERRVSDRKPKAVPEPLLMDVPPKSDAKQDWNTVDFVNPDRGPGHSELYQALEVLKAFINRPPRIRKTDGSIVIWLDANDLAVYFRIPPENPNCWLAWIPDEDLSAVEGSHVFLSESDRRAKHAMKGYWWCTGKFRGPRGNWKDANIMEGVQIIGKILELMDKPRK
ncbi:hypothetical protein JXA40_02905 [bacterium]|nr:hypothetical protein [candidate division CSSED10-310 bacterium]